MYCCKYKGTLLSFAILIRVFDSFPPTHTHGQRAVETHNFMKGLNNTWNNQSFDN